MRNAKHLQYLSGAKHSERHMLKFTLKPIFGFLFFIEGERQNHFCWELLNSHATYLWSFSKVESEFQFQYARIEKTISLVRQIGRDEYKREFKNGNIDGDLIFSVINHPDVNSSFKDGFVEWKHRLKERLV